MLARVSVFPLSVNRYLLLPPIANLKYSPLLGTQTDRLDDQKNTLESRVRGTQDHVKTNYCRPTQGMGTRAQGETSRTDQVLAAMGKIHRRTDP